MLQSLVRNFLFSKCSSLVQFAKPSELIERLGRGHVLTAVGVGVRTGTDVGEGKGRLASLACCCCRCCNSDISPVAGLSVSQPWCPIHSLSPSACLHPGPCLLW